MTAHFRHQEPLERILDFSPPSLIAPMLDQADGIFNRLISHYEPLQSGQPYKKVTLVRLTYEYSRSKDTFLQQFFTYIDTPGHPASPSFERGLSRFSDLGVAAPAHQKRDAGKAVEFFAEYLFDNFFLPSMYIYALACYPVLAHLFQHGKPSGVNYLRSIETILSSFYFKEQYNRRLKQA